jgi:CubicO group peptidase (beta-lactamase class C family)
MWDEHKVSLNDTTNRWMPKLPEASKVTLKMLANQTSGYPDFETDPAWTAASTPTRSISSPTKNGWATPSPGRSSSPRGRTGATPTPTS